MIITEIISAVLVVAIAIGFFTSSSLYMPMTLSSILITTLVLVFVVFAALVWKENPADEREAYHAMKTGRAAFLMGVGALVLGIIVQFLEHEIDPWLIFALCTMVVTKIILLAYSRYKM